MDTRIPNGTTVIVHGTKAPGVYAGLTGIIIGQSPYDENIYRVRFTPPAEGQPETDYIPTSWFSYTPPVMQKFEAQVALPRDFQSYFEAFQGEGNLRYSIDNGSGVFEVEAYDLNGAAEIIQQVSREIESGTGFDARIGQAKPVAEFITPAKVEKILAITPHEVDVPIGTGQVVMQSDPRRTYWPVEAVATILKAHGIEVAE